MNKYEIVGAKIEDVGENPLTLENYHIKLNISDYNEYTRSTTNYEIEFTGAQLLSTPSLDKPIEVKGRKKPIKLYMIHNFKWLAGKIVRRVLHDGIISKEEYLSFLFDHLCSNYIRLGHDFSNITDDIVQMYYKYYAPTEIINKYKDNGGFLSFIEKYKYKTFKTYEFPNEICYYERGGNFVGCYYDDENRIRPRHDQKEKVCCCWALFYMAIRGELNETESVPER